MASGEIQYNLLETVFERENEPEQAQWPLPLFWTTPQTTASSPLLLRQYSTAVLAHVQSASVCFRQLQYNVNGNIEIVK